MNTYKWLLKREFWEHKGGFFWTPAVIGALMTLFLAISMAFGLVAKSQHGMQINGEQVTNLGKIVTPEQKAQAIEAISTGYIGTSAPLFMVMAFVVFFFCLGTLFDERKDRSVLFWKSLPVSDTETVLSKAAMALVGAPLLTYAFAVVTSLLALLIICVGSGLSGLNIFGGVLTSAATYTSPLELLAILPVYAVWALPTVGWLMMVSAWARTKVFLWAVGAPVLTVAMIAWFNAMFDFNLDVAWLWKNIVARGLLSVVPGAWFGFVDPAGGMQVHNNHLDFTFLLTQSWKTLASVHAAVGAVVGAAMIFAAARIRRWKDEG
jgi:ABC-2 type transport system permease protein